MLHGTITINGNDIGGWTAVAIRDFPAMVAAGTSCDYSCDVTHNGRTIRVIVEHAYDDGALVLLHKILGAVIPIFKSLSS